MERVSVKRVSSPFETTLSAAILFLGLYMLYEGSSNKSATAPAILIGGAVCLTLSVMTLVSAVRSILWHRRMLRHPAPNHGLDSPAPRQYRG
jgi:hypothetical protein